MLTFFPPNTTPDLDALACGAEFNDDGHGFAIVTPDEVIVRHGLDGADMIVAFDELRDQYPSGPALFHSRFATHGACDVDNCHPFPVDHDSRTVLAHNGILPRRVQPKRGDRRSDTRIAAEDFLPRKSYSAWDDPGAQRDLKRWLGPGNKLVVLTIDPRYREHAYLINESAGIWDDGIWYSNGDYRGYTDVAVGASSSLGDPDAYWPCPVCLAQGAIGSDGYCPVCGSCADCAEPDGYCVCYAPERFPSLTRPGNVWSSCPDEIEVWPAPVEVPR